MCVVFDAVVVVVDVVCSGVYCTLHIACVYCYVSWLLLDLLLHCDFITHCIWLRDLRSDLETAQAKHEQEVREICESKLKLVRALGAAMDSMREELRPKKP